MSHNLKVGNKALSGIDKLTVTDTNGSQVTFIAPSAGENGSLADTWNYTTQFNYGTYKPSADTAISATSITVGFKPKIFAIRSATGMWTKATKAYINNSWMILNNNYEYVKFTLPVPDKTDGSTQESRTGVSTGFNYDSTLGAQSQHSNGQTNVFWPTSNGVAGNGGSGTYYFMGGETYYWCAWG